MQRSPIDLPYIVYDPPTVIITLNSNTGIHVRYVPVVRYIVNSTEFQYISMHLVCGCPLTTAHPFFVRTPHNHTLMESARSEDSNGVWYVFPVHRRLLILAVSAKLANQLKELQDIHIALHSK